MTIKLISANIALGLAACQWYCVSEDLDLASNVGNFRDMPRLYVRAGENLAEGRLPPAALGACNINGWQRR
jgi:hypothetical protein